MTTPQNKVAYWQALSDEWATSGELQKAFCQRKGISYGQFVKWRNKLASKQSKSQLQPVNIIPSAIVASPKSINLSSAHEVVIHLNLPNGINVGITTGATASQIAEVLNGLGFIA